jgi:glutathione S-transferase
LDRHLEGRTHVACGRLTIADFQLASMARYWVESQMPMESFRNTERWLDGLTRIPAWADPWPVTSLKPEWIEPPSDGSDVPQK